MRWKNYDNSNSERVVFRFLIFPKTLYLIPSRDSIHYDKRETRWLEFAKIRQYLKVNSRFPMMRRWVDFGWAD